MKQKLLFMWALCSIIIPVHTRSSTMRGLFGGAGTGALIGGLAGGGRGAGYGALAGGILGTTIGASEDARRRRRYEEPHNEYYEPYDYEYYETAPYGYYESRPAYYRSGSRRRKGGYARNVNRRGKSRPYSYKSGRRI